MAGVAVTAEPSRAGVATIATATVATATVAALVVGASFASAPPGGADRSAPDPWAIVVLERLPEPLRAEAATAARRAARRHEASVPPLPASRTDAVPEVAWDLTNGWRVDWDGRTGVDLGVSARTVLVDPRAQLDLATANLDRRRATLEAELATHDALASWAEHRIALWRTERRLEIARAAARLPPPRDPDVARSVASLRAIEPDLRHDRERLVAWLHRYAARPGPDGTPDRDELPDPGPAPWAAWTERPSDPDPYACTAGRSDLRLARLALDEARARDEPDAERRPTVTLGASADLGVHAIGSTAPSFGGRVWLEVGAPSLWSVAGAARTELDPHGATVRLRASGATGAAAAPDRRAERSARQARAEQQLADAAFRADAWAHATAYALRSARTHLRELGPPPASDAPTVQESVAAARSNAAAALALETAWERTELLARIASLAIELDRACAAAPLR